LTVQSLGVTLRVMVGIAGLGMGELLVILVIVVVLFGARRLPEIGSGLGNAIKNFKAGISGKDEIDVTPKKEELKDPKE
jgi:sec-independent protein translocase protein TatA